MLTNTIGQRNRNTLAINSKRTPSERNNELQESRREQVHWSREESTSCREVELYETSQTDGAQGCQSFQRPRPLGGIRKRSSGPDERYRRRLDWTRRGTHGLEAGNASRPVVPSVWCGTSPPYVPWCLYELVVRSSLGNIKNKLISSL